jgi:hypothetical protein
VFRTLGSRRIAVTLALTVATATALTVPRVDAGAAVDDRLWFDNGALSVAGTSLMDPYGRQVTLRGFNVSGETKLAEHGQLPFADEADAARSAAAMRRLTGANAVRFLLSWAAIEPSPGQYDTGYLAKVTAQIRVFLDAGIRVLLDYHQDLYSRYLFNQGSWYTGDGAPPWVVAAGNYPKENCGICVQWGQNITQNAAVQNATFDFWHNRVLNTAAGPIGVQDAFLRQAQASLSYLRANLSAQQQAGVVGVDPFNEPYAGRYDSGQSSTDWERDLLWPFYQRFRDRMDAAGWPDRPAFVEPGMFWNANLFFTKQAGGFTNIGALGSRYVFNAHFYDQQELSGIFMLGKAKDGRYVDDFATVRGRGSALGTAAIVTEFGSPYSGTVAGKTPSVLKAMYQALDSTVGGKGWWSNAARSGPALSATQWQWDIYNGHHHELMNGNPDKVQTTGDAWNTEDFSAITTDPAGGTVLRSDQRVLDRLYPAAVAGTTVAFTYEDRARDGSTTLTWNPVPASLPNVARLVGSGQYGVLVWRGGSGEAPTELHLPASFTSANTTVISDLGVAVDPPSYAATGHTANASIAVAPDGPDARRLLLSAPTGVHFALVTNGSTAPGADLTAAARTELAGWAVGVAR